MCSYKRTSKTDVKCSWLCRPKNATRSNVQIVQDLFPERKAGYRCVTPLRAFFHTLRDRNRGGNAERQKLCIRSNFRAQVNVLPVAKLFHGFAKCGIGLELTRSKNQNSDKNSSKIGGWN